MDEREFDLQVVVASGKGEAQRAVFGFASALTASASGTRVVVALTMHGANWAADTEGTDSPVPGFPPIAEMIELIQENGGQVQACSACIENYCPSPVGEDGLKVLRAGLTRVGLATIAGRMTSVPTVLC